MFRRASNRYGDTPEPMTPYQRAAQAWDERIGSARVQAKNWRLMAFCCLAFAVALAGGLLWQSGESRITPYVVEVDRLGEARAVAPAIEGYDPTDAQIAHALARFIENVRSLSTDPVVVRKRWLEAYDYATGRAVGRLNAFALEADPFGNVGTRSVAVEVGSVVRASETSFQVKWTERVFERGSLSRTERWTGILSILLRPPRDAETLRKNPLGIHVRDLDWSRDFQPGESP